MSPVYSVTTSANIVMLVLGQSEISRLDMLCDGEGGDDGGDDSGDGQVDSLICSLPPSLLPCLQLSKPQVAGGPSPSCPQSSVQLDSTVSGRKIPSYLHLSLKLRMQGFYPLSSLWIFVLVLLWN